VVVLTITQFEQVARLSNRAYGANNAGLMVVREDVDVISGAELDAEAERVARLLLGDVEMQFPRDAAGITARVGDRKK
jgi:hypothetical protein